MSNKYLSEAEKSVLIKVLEDVFNDANKFSSNERGSFAAYKRLRKGTKLIIMEMESLRKEALLDSKKRKEVKT